MGNRIATFWRTAYQFATFLIVLFIPACGWLVEEEAVREEAPGHLSQALVTDCEHLDPAKVAVHDAGWTTVSTAVDYDKEVVIRDTSVVNDPCRTANSPPDGGCPNGFGAWTFKTLMTNLAGTIPPQTFVANWIKLFDISVSNVNGYTVSPRSEFRSNFMNAWLSNSGCSTDAGVAISDCTTLDLDNAPFRLLAIVNRIDLSPDFAGATVDGGVTDAGIANRVGKQGEARFVFGLLDGGTAGGNPLAATVIIEYNLPTSDDVPGWAARWHALSSLSGATYNDALQAITDDITKVGAQPGGPNSGISLAHLRTNEIAFDTMGVWEMRQFEIKPIAMGSWNRTMLKMTPVEQTPEHDLVGNSGLDDWLAANSAAIGNATHKMPDTYVHGDAGTVHLLAGAAHAGDTWTSGALSSDERHMFGFATCSGCHNQETNTTFLHISNRASNVASSLSGFLGSTTTRAADGGTPAGSLTFTDPEDGMATRSYNEPWRRLCEITRILHGVTTPYTRINGAH